MQELSMRNSGTNPLLKKRTAAVTLRFGLLLSSLCVLSFLIGQLYGYHIGLLELNQQCFFLNDERTMEMMSEEEWMDLRMTQKEEWNEKTKKSEEQTNKHNKITETYQSDTKTSKLTNSIIAARISKTDFTNKFDFGYPISPEESDAFILYNCQTSMPNNYAENIISTKNNDSLLVPKFSVENALENCETVNVMMTDNPENLKQCLAIVPEYESYHVQRWLRLNPKVGGKVDPTIDLTPVSRGTTSSGSQLFIIPGQNELKKSWEYLRLYIENLDTVLDELKQITGRIQKNNIIIVITCNFGQSELLMNFACSARTRGLDTTNVLVFATDRETKELAESVGLNTYFFGNHFQKTFPKQAANSYADDFFTSMMISKVISVQLISLLGYDIIFQDVDIIWWREPMEYFLNALKQDKFDMYFQEDGNRIRYTPLSANSGFYMVRNNRRTKYLLTSLLYSLDKILMTGSHQEALVTHLNEHISLYNLRVKVISREDFNFPGGFHYHRRGHVIKQFFENKLDSMPYLFHMSWTKNKEFKFKFFQQMGEWFVHDKCIAKRTKEIQAYATTTTTTTTTTKNDLSFDFGKTCCLVEPNITCWYRDKPSKKPCKTSEGLDGGPSYW